MFPIKQMLRGIVIVLNHRHNPQALITPFVALLHHHHLFLRNHLILLLGHVLSIKVRSAHMTHPAHRLITVPQRMLWILTSLAAHHKFAVFLSKISVQRMEERAKLLDQMVPKTVLILGKLILEGQSVEGMAVAVFQSNARLEGLALALDHVVPIQHRLFHVLLSVPRHRIIRAPVLRAHLWVTPAQPMRSVVSQVLTVQAFVPSAIQTPIRVPTLLLLLRHQFQVLDKCFHLNHHRLLLHVSNLILREVGNA